MRKAMYLTNILLILLSLFLTINKSVGFCLFVFVFLITLAMHLQTSSYEFGYLKNEELFKYMDVVKIKIKSLYPMNKKQKISYYQYYCNICIEWCRNNLCALWMGRLEFGSEEYLNAVYHNHHCLVYHTMDSQTSILL